MTVNISNKIKRAGAYVVTTKEIENNKDKFTQYWFKTESEAQEKYRSLNET